MSLYTYPHEHDGPGWASHKVANHDSTDPVCDTTVGQRTAHHTLDRGREVLFCSMRCKERFLAEPARYRHATVVMRGSASELTPARSVAQGTEYTCPMHPEIVRSGPGNCPICGMTLEPRPALRGPDPELRDLTRRFWIAVAFTLPLFITTMADLLGVTFLSGGIRVSMAIGLATPVCVWAAWPIYVRIAQSLRTRRLNLFALIGLGVGVAYIYSVVAALVPGVFPSSFFRRDGTVASYFEPAAVIVTFVLLAQLLERRARGQISAAAHTLRVVAATSAAILGMAIASGCTKANDNAPPPAHEQAQVVQNALALPPSAAPTHPAAEAVPVATATPPPIPSSIPVGTELSMERLLGVPPTPKPIHQGAAPHLFHLGATSFFLDHSELALTVEQRSKLSAIRETAGLGYATAQRKIDQAEQELWAITSAEHPSASRVEAKLTEIARLSTRQRMDYILAIGQAVAQLTYAQHGMLAIAPTGSGTAAVPMPADPPPQSASGSAANAMPMPVDPPPGMPMGGSDSAKPMGHM